jgi:hemolysin activation/secretion protein
MIRRAAFAAAALAATQAAAQLPPALDPGAIQQRRIEEERRREELERLQRKPVTDPLKREAVDKPAVKPAPEAVRFLVREIRFTPSEILTAEELESVARDYRGKHVTFAELQELAARINALYKAKGVVTAQAVIPPQDVSEGIVQVRLVEGRVGKIGLEGNASTREGYVTDRLTLKRADLVDLQRLERDLIRFNRTNDAQLRAELKPGAEFATTDLLLTLAEPPRHDLRLFLDNSGSASTGEWRAGVTYLNRSLLGWRDDLSLTTSRAGGQESYAASYGIPFNRWGGRASLAWYKDRTASKYGLLAPLEITGESEAYILTLRQPAYVDARAQVDVLAGGKKRDSTTWISGLFLQGIETQDANLGLEVQLADERGYWLASYTANNGTAQVAGVNNDDDYFAGRGTLRRLHDLGKGWSFRGNLNFQHTGNDLLPSSEQFFIGGDYSVRGYPVGAFSGDQGYSINLELHHPIEAKTAHDVALSGFFFLDNGYVKVFRPPNSVLRDFDEISGVGWGLNATIMKRVYGRLTFAYALNDLPLEPRRYVIHFQLVASVF